MSALSKFHSTRLSFQELLSGRIRLQRYGLFLKLKHLYPNKMQINFILATRLQRNRLTFPDFSRHLLLEEIGYVVETVSIFDRTTAVVRLHNSWYAHAQQLLCMRWSTVMRQLLSRLMTHPHFFGLLACTITWLFLMHKKARNIKLRALWTLK